jgi:hypothetical protein
MTFAVTKNSNYIYTPLEIFDDQRFVLKKIFDLSAALLREIVYVFTMIHGRIFNDFSLYSNPVEWKENSQGLYVLIHGLNGHPGIWQTHVNLLKRDELDKDLFIPFVPLKGNGKLKAVVPPILATLKDYAQKNPGKPICLIGVSNGGRICTWLESQLRTEVASTPVKVSTIAAVHFGSSRMDWFKWFHEWTGWSLGGYTPSVVKELCFGSKKAKKILDRISQPLPNGVTRGKFEFFASTEDFHVPDFICSIPKIGDHPSKKHIVHGYAHSGIVSGVAQQQVQSCKKWMAKITSIENIQ